VRAKELGANDIATWRQGRREAGSLYASLPRVRLAVVQ